MHYSRSDRLGAVTLGLGVLAALAASLAAGQPPATAQARRESAGERSPVTQRLVFAHYYYSFQGDPRKQAPFRHVRDAKGLTLFTHHPWESVGPWTSFDRVQWHKNQFQMMAGGGIDVALAVYRGDQVNRRAYAIKGLDVMTQALKEFRAEGLVPLMKRREFPQIGMALDLGGLADQHGGPVDLKNADVQRSLYGMVRDFYLHVPEEFRATVQLPAARLTGAPGKPIAAASTSQAAAYVVRLLGDAAVRDADDAFLRYAGDRFAREFGARLIWVGTPALAAKVKTLDAVAPFPAASQPAALNDAGWIRTGSLGPGYDDATAAQPIRPRENGQQTVTDFRRILDAKPDWVFIDSWNGYQHGTDVAPSLEHGLLYRDLIRGAVLQYKQSADYAAGFLKASAPRVMQPGLIYQMDLIVQNSGTSDWDDFNLASLSYRWLKDGKYVGDPGVPISSPGQVRGDTQAYLIGVAAPINEGKSLPAGEYELEFHMVRRIGNENVPFPHDETPPLRIPITVGPAPASRPYWVSSTMPTLTRRGETYTAQVRLRNDGTDSWKKDAVSVGYRWRKVSTYLRGAVEDADVVVAEGKRVQLGADVATGRSITVDVPVSTVDGSGQPLVTWSPQDDWCYVLEWEMYDSRGAMSGSGAAALREPIEVLDRDPAPFFLGCSLPSELVAGRTEKITVGLRNNGPETWKKDRDKVIVHWYYMDGTEAAWNDDSLPLPEDVPPFSRVQVQVPADAAEKLFGAPEADKKDRKDKRKREKFKTETVLRDTVLRDVPVRVPYYFGPMYCVLDFQHDGLMASTSAASKGNDLLVLPVNVYSPTFTPLPISVYYNVDGMSQDVDRRDGNLDGRGNSLPAEFLPPYVPRPAVGPSPASNPLYPSGLWSRPLNDLDSSRVCFLYPAKANGQPNFIGAQGQRIEFGGLSRTAVHVMGLCTEADASGEFVLFYSDGSSEKKKVAFTHWNERPKHGERIAFTTPHRHTATGDDPATRCYLSHYTLPANPQKTLVGVELPRLPALKVMAITLESASIRAN